MKLSRAEMEATVRRFLSLLEEGDMEAWFDLYAEGATNTFPFNSGIDGFDPELRGEQLRAAWNSFPVHFERVSLTVDALFVDEEQQTVVVCMDSHNLVDMEAPDNPWTAAGANYDNRYVCLFRFDPASGKLADYTEYYNPLVTGAALGAFEISFAGPGE